jgi:hypothetical protein
MHAFLILSFSTIAIFAVAFFGGRFYFREPNRALVFGLAMAAMFFVTYNLREDSGPAEQSAGTDVASPAAIASAAAVALAPTGSTAPTTHNVSALCSVANAADSMPLGTGAVDAVRADSSPIESGQSVSASEPLIVAGWAIDWRAHRPAKAVCLSIDGKPARGVRATYGIERADVGAALRDPSLGSSGFGLQVPAHALSPGAHVLQVMVASNASVWARLGRPFLVRST